MHFPSIATTAAIALLAGLASAATTHKILVGKDGLSFTPNSTTAAAGDTVTFLFYPQAHSVVQGGFADACQPLAGGFFSGFVPTASGLANTSYSITVNDTSPIWFYCSRGKHCQEGMVGVINQASGTKKTLAAYASAAAAATNNTSPTVSDGFGGTLAVDTSVSSASGTASTSSGSTAASSGSSSTVATGAASALGVRVPMTVVVGVFAGVGWAYFL